MCISSGVFMAELDEKRDATVEPLGLFVGALAFLGWF